MNKAQEEQLGSEMYNCHDCKLVNFDAEYPEGTKYWTLLTGQYWYFPGGGETSPSKIPLSSSFIPCEKHREVCESTCG